MLAPSYLVVSRLIIYLHYCEERRQSGERSTSPNKRRSGEEEAARNLQQTRRRNYTEPSRRPLDLQRMFTPSAYLHQLFTEYSKKRRGKNQKHKNGSRTATGEGQGRSRRSNNKGRSTAKDQHRQRNLTTSPNLRDGVPAARGGTRKPSPNLRGRVPAARGET